MSPHFYNQLHIVNQWQQRVDGRIIAVLAGRQFQSQDSQQGAVLVATVEEGTGTLLSGPDIYLTPIRAGEVTVEDAVGVVLTLRVADGSLLYFDLTTRQWVNP